MPDVGMSQTQHLDDIKKAAASEIANKIAPKKKPPAPPVEPTPEQAAILGLSGSDVSVAPAPEPTPVPPVPKAAPPVAKAAPGVRDYAQAIFGKPGKGAGPASMARGSPGPMGLQGGPGGVGTAPMGLEGTGPGAGTSPEPGPRDYNKEAGAVPEDQPMINFADLLRGAGEGFGKFAKEWGPKASEFMERWGNALLGAPGTETRAAVQRRQQFELKKQSEAAQQTQALQAAQADLIAKHTQENIRLQGIITEQTNTAQIRDQAKKDLDLEQKKFENEWKMLPEKIKLTYAQQKTGAMIQGANPGEHY